MSVYRLRVVTKIVKQYRLQRNVGNGLGIVVILRARWSRYSKRKRFDYMRKAVMFRIRMTGHRSPLRQHSGMKSANDGVGRGYPKAGWGILRRWISALLILFSFLFVLSLLLLCRELLCDSILCNIISTEFASIAHQDAGFSQ